MNFSKIEFCQDCDPAENLDEGWMDDFDESKTPSIEPLSRFKMSNTVKANLLLSDDSINELLLGRKCVKGRRCVPCPNDGDCPEVFGMPRTARDIIREFRKIYWNTCVEAGQISARRKSLLEDLNGLKVITKGKTYIEYKINGIFVCKTFYWVK